MEDAAAVPAETPVTGSSTVLDQYGDTQRRLLEALLYHVTGRSADQLVQEVGVTANAVRQHLGALERDGLVTYDVAPAARGRPQHRYRLSERGREAFPRRYRQLAEAVLLELAAELDEPALARAMRRMGRRAAAVAAGADRASVPATARLMTQLGYEAETRSASEIAARNCVFHQLAQRFPAVCEFDLGFMEATTGRRVEHRECMLRGGACCRFHFRK
jgi:predicted ArsR family transcriptional regulator